jgi:hypothetical protein
MREGGSVDVANTIARENADEASEPEHEAGELRLVVDALGRKHLHNSRGRFVRQGNPISPEVARRVDGRRLLPGVDQRSPPYRRYKALVSALAVDQGGADMISATKAQLIKRFAAAGVLAEQYEIRLARGETLDANTLMVWASLAGVQVRVASRIGVERVPRDISGPTLGELLRAEDERQRTIEAEVVS